MCDLLRVLCLSSMPLVGPTPGTGPTTGFGAGAERAVVGVDEALVMDSRLRNGVCTVCGTTGARR